MAETFTMPVLNEKRACLSCDKPLKGRIDKKFCDDYCRNSYNNNQKAQGSHNNLVRNINNALLKNRKILESILQDTGDTAKANKEKMLRLGFQFKYLTHLYTTKTGKIYYYCFEYGYLPLENEWYLIVKRKED